MIGVLSGGTEGAKTHAANVIASFADKNEVRQNAIAEAGAIEPLVSILYSGTAASKKAAVHALESISQGKDTRAALIRHGAALQLVEFLRSSTADASDREQAVDTLYNLVISNEQGQLELVKAGAITPLIDIVRGAINCDRKATAALTLAWLAVTNDDHKIKIAKAGAVAPLVTLLGSGTDIFRQRAANALQLLANNAENKITIAKAGAVAPLVDLARNGANIYSKGQAALALKNLASENRDNRLAIAKAGAIEPLAELMLTGEIDKMETIGYALSIFTQDEESRAAVAVAIGLPESASETEVDAALPRASNNGAEVYNSLGVSLKYVRKHDDGAERMYRKAIELDSKVAKYHFNLGYLLSSVRNDTEGAEAMYRKALEVDPNYKGALNNLALILRSVRKDVNGAERMYRKVIELDPKYTNSIWGLSVCREDLNDIPGAIEFMEQYISLDGKLDGEGRLATLRAKL